MQIVSFVDLDDTLFQTLPKCPPTSSLTPAARSSDGKPLSFMTAKQMRFFDLLRKFGMVVPVTARNYDAFRRVELPFRDLAILDFGGVILDANGLLDQEWDDFIRPRANASKDALLKVLTAMQAYVGGEKLGIRVRLITDFDLPLYVVAKHPGGDLDALDRLQHRCAALPLSKEFFVHRNHNNLSIVPRFLGKENAVRHVLERHFRGDNVLTFGVGDSLTDLPYLKQCDYFVLPAISQLAARILDLRPN